MVCVWYAWYVSGTHRIRIWYACGTHNCSFGTHVVRIVWYAFGTHVTCLVRVRYASCMRLVRMTVLWYACGIHFMVRVWYAFGTHGARLVRVWYAFLIYAYLVFLVRVVRVSTCWYALSSLLMKPIVPEQLHGWTLVRKSSSK
jgi:hypothetical protein